MKNPNVVIKSLWGRRDAAARLSDDIDIIVFSRNRAPQLDLLLRSYRVHATPQPVPVHIQYSATSELHEQAYSVLLGEHAPVIRQHVREQDFKLTLLDLMQSGRARNVMFLVDDIVFIDDVPVDVLTHWNTQRSILSLRLGDNITRSFNSRVARQEQPVFRDLTVQERLFRTWAWHRGKIDWSLPTSLDGNVLPAGEILPIIVDQPFRGPNSLERALGLYRFLFKYRLGACFPSSRLVNLPLNTVKAETGFNFPNLMTNPDAMAEAYLGGRRLSVESYEGMQPDSCHIEWMPNAR